MSGFGKLLAEAAGLLAGAAAVPAPDFPGCDAAGDCSVETSGTEGWLARATGVSSQPRSAQLEPAKKIRETDEDPERRTRRTYMVADTGRVFRAQNEAAVPGESVVCHWHSGAGVVLPRSFSVEAVVRIFGEPAGAR